MRRARRALRAGWRPAVIGVAVVTLAGGALVVAVSDPPDRLGTSEVDGRTWLPVRRSEGETLVLANGISGLVEAEATIAGGVPDGARFAGSDARSTLLRGGDTAVLVADGTQRGEVIELDGAGAVLVDGRLLTLGATSEVRTVAADGSLGAPRRLPVGAQPRPGTSPVVDDRTTAWVLTTDEVMAVASDGRVEHRHPAPAGATGMIVVDGEAWVSTGEGLVRPDGERRRQGAAGGIVPTVATATDGRWAVGDGAALVVDGQRIDTGEPVDGLAVWHGAVWWSSDGGVSSLVGDRRARAARLSGPFHVFADGGRLWFVGRAGAVAVDERQQATVFRLTSLDVSLCIDDCSPDDAVDQSDRSTVPTTSGGDQPPPPTITLPPVLPPAPSTTAPSTTAPNTTAPTPTAPTPPRPTTTDPPRTSVAPAPAAPASTVVVPAATSTTVAVPVTATSVATTTTSAVALPSPDPEPDPPPPDPPGPPDPPPTSAAPRPEPGGAVILAVDGPDALVPGEVSVTIGFDGTADQCVANGGDPSGNRVTGDLTWSGATSGERTVTTRLGATATEAIVVEAGAFEVSFAVCGLRASVSRSVANTEPTVGAITIGGPPFVGETLTASVAIDPGIGWSLGSTSWRAGPCPEPADLGSGTVTEEGSSVTFTPTVAGEHCVSLLVSFVADQGGERTEERAATATIADPTTSTSTSTSTSVPTSSSTSTTSTSSTSTTTSSTSTTTTTSATTTTTSSSTTTTTAPPTTVAPATTTTTTTLATTTTSPPTTAPPPATTTATTATTSTSSTTTVP